MREFKVLYDNIESSFDAKGAALQFSSGEMLTAEDRLRFADSFKLWLCLTLDYSQSSEYSLIMDTFDTIWMYLVSGYPVDLFFTLIKTMVSWIRREESLSSLRAIVFDDVVMGRELFDLIKTKIRDRRKPDGFIKIHSILNFLPKLYLERESLSEEGVRQWVDSDSALANLPHSMDNQDWQEIQCIICHWLEPWSPELMEIGDFTNGSSADAGNSIYLKIHHSAIPCDLASLIIRDRPDLLGNTGVPGFTPIPYYQFWSRFVQVPKNALALRQISMETAACNYWQQTLDESLRVAIRSSPLARIFNPNSQSKNQLRAVEGSQDGSLATIDQSKASDSVRPDHIYAFFPPLLVEWLLATRSKFTVYGDDQVLYINKFAPMGSRLTFDLESIIFSAFGWLAEERAGIPEKDRRLTVFGDDIVIETEAVGYLKDLLDRYGFTMNIEKSFDSGFFRESCGIFAYKGVDVSSVTLPRSRFTPLSKANSETIAWLSSLADRAYYNNLPILRYFCVRTVMQYGTPIFRDPSLSDLRTILFGEPDEEWIQRGYYSMLSPAPTQWRMRKRKSTYPKPDYGNGLGRLLTPQQKYLDSTTSDDDASYEVWLYRAARRNPSTQLGCDDEITCRQKAVLGLAPRDRWVVLPN